MPKPLPNYLRTHRRRLGLTQSDVAFLVGVRSDVISRYELRARVPRLDGAFAIQVVLGQSTHELFPGVYEEVEAVVVKRARTLLRNWPSDQRPEQRFLLERLVSRAHVPAYET